MPMREPVDEECRRLLAALRERCPDLLTDHEYRAGEPGPEIPVDRERGGTLFRLVARRLAGLSEGAGVVVWTRHGTELAVLVDQVRVFTADGAAAVDLPVRCDQTKDATVRVRFALGSDRRPAGMVATTDERPFGPAEIVDGWGEALTAYAWQILVHSTASLADAAGRDADGAGLVPVGVRATREGLTVATIARHTFDRRSPR